MSAMSTPMTDAPVVEQIRHAILDGSWQPGERLGPVVLAERFGASTTVIREALTRLVGESLVAARTNRGFFLPEIDVAAFEDLTELRCVNETLGLRMALERGDLEWETRLLAAHHRMTKTPRRRPGTQQVDPEWRLAHWAYHQALLAGCGCEPLLRIASALSQSTELYRAWAAPLPAASRRNVEREHHELFGAVLARDADRASALLRRHYEETARVVVAGLAKLRKV